MSADIQESESLRQKNIPMQKSVAFYAALCLFLSALEYLIPKPLPFMRLGLANLPLILALYKFSLPSYLMLTLLKIFSQAYISGTFFSYIFVFSVCGTFASSLSMLALYHLFKKGKYISPIGISLCGSLSNASMQLLLTKLMLFKDSTKFVAPLLLISAFVTGFLLGLAAFLFMKKSRWFACETFLPDEKSPALNPLSEKEKGLLKVKSIFIFLLFFLLLSYFLFQKDYRISLILCLLFFLLHALQCCFLKKKFPKFYISLLVILSVVFFSLLSPAGKVLFTVGKFPVTYGALTSGLKRGSSVCGTLYLSKLLLNMKWKASGKIFVFLTEVLGYFSSFTNYKKKIHLKTFFSDLDAVLFLID